MLFNDHRKGWIKEEMIKITGLCVFCKKPMTVIVPLQGFVRWDNAKGPHIQEALPTVSPNDREFLLSGMCPKCFNEGTMDEDEES